MAVVTFKDLRIDVVDFGALEEFWAGALGLRIETCDDGERVLCGPTPQDTIWVNVMPEAKQIKNRVHLDLRAAPLDAFEAPPRLSEAGQFDWAVLADPEGDEFCVFAPAVDVVVE